MTKWTKEYRVEYMKKYFAKKKWEIWEEAYREKRRQEYSEYTRKNSLKYYYNHRERILKQKKEQDEIKRQEKLKKLINFKRNYLEL